MRVWSGPTNDSNVDAKLWIHVVLDTLVTKNVSWTTVIRISSSWLETARLMICAGSEESLTFLPSLDPTSPRYSGPSVQCVPPVPLRRMRSGDPVRVSQRSVHFKSRSRFKFSSHRNWDSRGTAHHNHHLPLVKSSSPSPLQKSVAIR